MDIMMRNHSIGVADMRDGYVDIVNWVRAEGSAVAPRGKRTVEIEDALIIVDNPEDTLPLGVGRNLNSGIASVEACQLLAGVSTPKLTINIGPNFKKFVEDNGMFHGAYGLRTRGQYEKIIDRLRRDPDTRQAVVTLWSPELDLLEEKRDYPCTVLHQFKIRSGALNMSVYMRSNDVYLGTAYDIFQFTRVQLAVASVLEIPVGSYAHHVGSLHLYEDSISKAEALHYSEGDFTAPPAIVGRNWFEVRASAMLALDAVIDDDEYRKTSSVERWYADAMRDAIKRNANTGLTGRTRPVIEHVDVD